MKKLILTFSLFIPLFLFSQDYETIVLFDVATKTSNNIKSVPIENDRTMIEVDFTSVNCDSLQFNIGYGLTDKYPVFLDTIQFLSLPATLNKAEYSQTYRGVASNILAIDILKHNGNYLWYEIINNTVTCTEGEVILRLK